MEKLNSLEFLWIIIVAICLESFYQSSYEVINLVNNLWSECAFSVFSMLLVQVSENIQICLSLMFSPTSRAHSQLGAQTRLIFLAKKGDKDQKIFSWPLLFFLFFDT